jgi:hypothetical protein
VCEAEVVVVNAGRGREMVYLCVVDSQNSEVPYSDV